MTSTHFLAQGHFNPQLNPQGPPSSENLVAAYETSLFRSHDGLPRTQLEEQYHLNPSISNFNIPIGGYIPTAASYQLASNQMDWSDHPNQVEEYQLSNEAYYGLSSTGAASQSMSDSAACPRSWPQMYDQRISMTGDFGLEESSEHQVAPEGCSTSMPDWSSYNYKHTSIDVPREFLRLSISHIPAIDNHVTYASPADFERDIISMDADIPSSRVSDPGDGDDEFAGSLSGSEERVSDEPYAKLIYRALMSVPSHAMALQEIYQWFKDNTDKGNTGTSGWRNSIRHNLSMNAVSIMSFSTER
jgi:hypothetical protein